MDGLTSGDLALMKDNDGFGGGNSWMWFLALLVLMGGGFGFGGNRPMPNNYATQQDITNAVNAQTSALNQQGIMTQLANQNYETANLINNQTNTYLQMHSADQSNMLQGFNTINSNMSNLFNQTNLALMNGFNTLGSKLDGITAHMDECCCSIKTLIKDNQIASLTNQLNAANTSAAIQAGNAYVLGQMGHWTPNATTTTTTG